MRNVDNDLPKDTGRGASIADDRLYSIGDLAAEFGISTRAIRFYETKGLIKPRRVGANRIYDHRDHGRLIIILRGKRLGFTLEEISQYLQLYDADPDQVAQIRHLLEKVEQTIADLEQKQRDIKKTLGELEDIRRQCIAGLKARGAVSANPPASKTDSADNVKD
ncbi:MAG: MerR family transcriptional regulator [Methyloligellaceae bacterium]